MSSPAQNQNQTHENYTHHETIGSSTFIHSVGIVLHVSAFEKYRDQSYRAVRRKLRSFGYSRREQDAVIRVLKEKGYGPR